MSIDETQNLRIRYLEGQQASKHITVNEAFARVDYLLSKQVIGFKINKPPIEASEGDAFIIGASPSGEWSGRQLDICYRINGGWEFFTPPVGWRVWIKGLSSSAIFVGGDWLVGALAVAKEGQSTIFDIISIEQNIEFGDKVYTDKFIPDKTIVLGVTALVLSDFEGAESWSLGSLDSYDRYGSGHSCTSGTKVVGVTSTPLAYFGGSGLVISSDGNKSFTSGSVLISVHTLSVLAPI